MVVSPDFVRHELSKVFAPKEASGSLWVPCPFHNETVPSLQVSLGKKYPVGTFLCYGCGTSGSWNKIAEKLGLATVTSDGYKQGDKLYVNSIKIELYEPIKEHTLTLDKLKDKWKRYSIEFLEQFGAQRLWHDKYADYFIYLPVTYTGDYQGFIRVRLNPDLGPKYYINLKQKIFYPFDKMLEYDTTSIVLVEGVADVFRLIKNRIPALAVLGTHFDIDFGTEMLNTLAVKTVILCMDGDVPGKKANIKLYTELTKKKFDVRILQLHFKYKKVYNKTLDRDDIVYKEKCDPDDMDKKYLKVLRKMILNTGGKLL